MVQGTMLPSKLACQTLHKLQKGLQVTAHHIDERDEAMKVTPHG